jgi:hypothetical protein
MGDWGVDRWLAFAALLVAIIACILAYYFYRKTIRTKLLAIAYTDEVRTMVVDTSSEFFEDQIGFARRFVLLWNRGSAPIEESDFIEPIKIKTDVQRVSIFDKDAAATVKLSERPGKITVQLLRPGEAIILELFVSTSENPNLEVNMKSADMSIFFQRSTVIPDALLTFWLAVFGVCMIGASFFILGITSSPEGMEFTQISLFSVGATAVLGVGLFLLPEINARIQRMVTPLTVAKFFQLKAAAATASYGAEILRRAYRSFAEARGERPPPNQHP